MTDIEIKALLQRVKKNLRVSKVVATRSVKGKSGDYFAGFSAGYNSTQEEPLGQGKDLVSTLSDSELMAQIDTQGMTLMESQIAFYLVAMQADISAHEAAMASGGISPQYCADSVAAIRSNYAKLIHRALSKSGNTEPSDR